MLEAIKLHFEISFQIVRVEVYRLTCPTTTMIIQLGNNPLGVFGVLGGLFYIEFSQHSVIIDHHKQEYSQAHSGQHPSSVGRRDTSAHWDDVASGYAVDRHHALF